MKIALVGAGGIGSWTAMMLSHLITAEQLASVSGKLRSDDITVFDNDIVERKNLRHQLYYASELGMPKSVLIANRTGFNPEYRRFGEKDLAGFDYFLLAVDNSHTRKLVYDRTEHSSQRFIDMRAEGRNYVIFTHKYPRAKLSATLGSDPASQKGFSCQLARDTVVKQVNLGNMGVAPAGMQILMDDLRGRPVPGMVYVKLNREID